MDVYVTWHCLNDGYDWIKGCQRWSTALGPTNSHELIMADELVIFGGKESCLIAEHGGWTHEDMRLESKLKSNSAADACWGHRVLSLGVAALKFMYKLWKLLRSQGPLFSCGCTKVYLQVMKKSSKLEVLRVCQVGVLDWVTCCCELAWSVPLHWSQDLSTLLGTNRSLNWCM